jgi:hypothetical protein
MITKSEAAPASTVKIHPTVTLIQRRTVPRRIMIMKVALREPLTSQFYLADNNMTDGKAGDSNVTFNSLDKEDASDSLELESPKPRSGHGKIKDNTRTISTTYTVDDTSATRSDAEDTD